MTSVHDDARVVPVRGQTTEELGWFHDVAPTWDHDKSRVVGSAPPGVFDLPYASGDALRGEWWAACNPRGHVVGYGWLDVTWGGDAEILLAVDPGHRRGGVGSFVLGRLEQEALGHGVERVHHVVRDSHPARDAVLAWLGARGYAPAPNPDVMCKQLGAVA